ncbi:PilW family protein [Piscinibacter koreensis]|uniref:PilW family protein n=1 Tax=Piscinibacter koreensis TaxID=2742824 RepID=A0A7Y6NM05_9BURK|nr:PilW family protein [Schlegelella koreensis]NUZ05648.1 PilW family protein [Schlegelella koreensis]
MRTSSHLGCAGQRGLSLIEIMVGVAIGLVGVVAIFQTVALWTQHSQTTTSGGDAQIAGTLAIYNLETDLRHGGLGFATAPPTVMGCNVTATDARGAFAFRLRPIQINVGAGGGPDTIDVLHGNSSFFVTEQTFSASTANSKALRRRNGFRAGDLAVVAGNATAVPGSADCRLIEITNVSAPDGVTVAHATGAYTSAYAASGAASATARFNTPGSVTFTGGTIYNLGPQPVRNTWSIRDSRALIRTELIADAGGAEVADGVVNLKAEYGIDNTATPDGVVDVWQAAAPADWTRVMAVRIAVLVRSRQFEYRAGTNAPTPTAPTWAGGTFLMKDVDGGSGAAADSPNNWRNYRYRVYERIVPLRNMLWGGLS